MPTIRRTSATLIAGAVLAGGAGVASTAIRATNADTTPARPAPVPAAALPQAPTAHALPAADTVLAANTVALVETARKAKRKTKSRATARKAHNKSIARPMVGRRGWSHAQFSCLSRLWNRESGWNHRARNPYSGAYGIPQALPGGKMASAGKDWLTNPKTQIKWGLSYIKGRYGTPCSAWSHARSHGWY
jgi:hypothetical protein